MKIMSASVILLALVAAEPALAGCGGSHGAYRSQSARAPMTVRKVVKKVEPKREAKSPGAATAMAPATAAASAVVATPAPPAPSAAPAECKQYSAAIGTMIAVPCS